MGINNKRGLHHSAVSTNYLKFISIEDICTTVHRILVISDCTMPTIPQIAPTLDLQINRNLAQPKPYPNVFGNN